jgi:glycosyltransferase involved in cell wall biosynthesis
MRQPIVFLEQQSWLGGAQRVLESVLDSVADEYDTIVAFPDRGPFRSALEKKNVPTIDLPIGNYAPGAKSFLEMVAFAWRSLLCGVRLATMIRRKRIALVYINGPRLLPTGVIAAWLTGRPTIFHLHLVLERRLDILLVTRLARRVSRILACSNAAAASLSDHDPRLSAKTRVVYNPLRQLRKLDVVGQLAMSHRDQFTVGMVGRITEKKGQHLLLRAVSTLPTELREKVRLLIIGSAAPGCEPDRLYAERLRADAARYGIEGRIVWAGHQADPASSYASMDVLVHPALSEAMGLVILEALASGIPVIASRTGGTPEAVRDGLNGLLISIENESELSMSLALFLSSGEVRERLKAGASQGLDSRFSMETFASSVRAAIRPLCFPVTSTDVSAFPAGSERL